MTGNILSGVRIQARRDHARRHQHGPGARQPPRPGHRRSQPGARLRAADDRLPRDELLDGLQFAHLVAERRLAASRTKSIRRWRSTACSRTAATCETSASSTALRTAPPSLSRQVSSCRSRQARRIPDQRPRGREAASSACAVDKDKAEDRAHGTAACSHDEAPRQRPARGSARAHPADVRHHRPGVPDRQDAHRLAALCRDLSALYYPFLDVREATTRLAQRHVRRLRAHRPLPPQPIGLSGADARSHARRRRHRARQFLPDVHLEHVVRHPARQHERCRSSPPAASAARCKTGRVLDTWKPATTTASCAACISGIMDRMGVRARPFGDADTRLALF